MFFWCDIPKCKIKIGGWNIATVEVHHCQYSGAHHKAQSSFYHNELILAHIEQNTHVRPRSCLPPGPSWSRWSGRWTESRWADREPMGARLALDWGCRSWWERRRRAARETEAWGTCAAALLLLRTHIHTLLGVSFSGLCWSKCCWTYCRDTALQISPRTQASAPRLPQTRS